MATVELRRPSVMKTPRHAVHHTRWYALNDVEARDELSLCVKQAEKLASFPEWRGASIEVDTTNPKKPSATVTHKSGAVARFGPAARERAWNRTYGGAK